MFKKKAKIFSAIGALLVGGPAANAQYYIEYASAATADGVDGGGIVKFGSYRESPVNPKWSLGFFYGIPVGGPDLEEIPGISSPSKDLEFAFGSVFGYEVFELPDTGLNVEVIVESTIVSTFISYGRDASSVTDVRSLIAAARASYDIGESFGAYAQLGFGSHRFSTELSAPNPNGSGIIVNNYSGSDSGPVFALGATINL